MSLWCNWINTLVLHARDDSLSPGSSPGGDTRLKNHSSSLKPFYLCSDIYIDKLDLWIEIDGINREKRKKWLGKKYNYWIEKLDHYKKEKLNYTVVYNDKELKEYLCDSSLIW